MTVPHSDVPVILSSTGKLCGECREQAAAEKEGYRTMQQQVLSYWRDLKKAYRVYAWVVDDLIGHEQLSVWVLDASFIRHLNSPFHAPTEPVSLGQSNCDITKGGSVAFCPHLHTKQSSSEVLLKSQVSVVAWAMQLMLDRIEH